MAKALYGHLAGNEAALRWENDRLRARVSELQAEVDRLAVELAADRALAAVTAQESLATAIEAGSGHGLRPALA